MSYQKLVGQGTRTMYICPSDITDIPNPSDIRHVGQLRTVGSGSATIIEIAAVDPTTETLGVAGEDIVYIYDVAGPLLGCATVVIPRMANDRQFTIEMDTVFAAAINLSGVGFNIQIFKAPIEFPMVSCQTVINFCETTFISAGGDGIELTDSGGTLSPSAYGNPSGMSDMSSQFPVQIRKIFLRTVDKTGTPTDVSTHAGWETYYLGTW